MAYAPIALSIMQYDEISLANWWMKAYQQGTTTPLAMATDATGGTTAAKFQLNSDGFPVTAGGALVVPFINGQYDLWLFPNAIDADANDTTNALQLADNLNADPSTGNKAGTDLRYSPVFATVASITAPNPVSIDGVEVVLVAGMTVTTQGYTTAGDGGGAEYLIVAPQAADGYGDHVLANGNVAVLQIEGGIVNMLAYGLTDAAVDQKAKIEAAAIKGDPLIPALTSQITLSSAPAVGAKTVRLQKFDQIDPVILKDLNAMVTAQGYQGGQAQATQFKHFGIDILAGSLRKEAVGTDVWNWINDAGHETIGFDGSTPLIAGGTSLVIPTNLTLGASPQVLSCVATPDEYLAAFGCTAGLSSGTSSVTLQLSMEVKQTYLAQWNGVDYTVTVLNSGGGNAPTVTNVGNAARIVFTRNVLPHISLTPWNNNGTVTPHIPVFSTFINGYTFDVDFYDLVTGAANPAVSTQNCFKFDLYGRSIAQLNGSTGGAPSDLVDAALTTGNIWIFGVQRSQ